ncbi:hypothetical protein VV02_00470 [Luteipulveratus mongoliensis]|uniref:Uncharacterized protein n=1 Tax=Luteipulveratus mongoliensis TaxID=571913 RepID=A0A0K1JDN7_9MICO|nr:hypothetical protein VV02_00470 [Luteipulveratus mongoliensis]
MSSCGGAGSTSADVAALTWWSSRSHRRGRPVGRPSPWRRTTSKPRPMAPSVRPSRAGPRAASAEHRLRARPRPPRRGRLRGEPPRAWTGELSSCGPGAGAPRALRDESSWPQLPANDPVESTPSLVDRRHHFRTLAILISAKVHMARPDRLCPLDGLSPRAAPPPRRPAHHRPPCGPYDAAAPL